MACPPLTLSGFIGEEKSQKEQKKKRKEKKASPSEQRKQTHAHTVVICCGEQYQLHSTYSNGRLGV
jgi:hypothetical protein